MCNRFQCLKHHVDGNFLVGEEVATGQEPILEKTVNVCDDDYFADDKKSYVDQNETCQLKRHVHHIITRGRMASE